MIDNKFIFGIDDLDKSFKDALYPSSVIVVAGHPGSGKTTFASTICYSNATSMNNKCLYISFQEDKEKFMRFMSSVGMDFKRLEDVDVFRFLKFPMILDIDVIINYLSNILSEFKPRIVVVDSLNAVMHSVRDEEKRAWVQNYFYELAKTIQGIVILIAEVPFGEERVSLGSIEFIADAILILKHRIEKGLLSRYMEIRKIRGIPVNIAEIVFSITSSGLKVLVPPILSEIPRHVEDIDLFCSSLKRVIGYINRGDVVYIEYPSNFRAIDTGFIAVVLACVHKLKALVISYRYSPETLKYLLLQLLIRKGLDEETANRILNKYFIFKGINPYAQSLSQTYAEEIGLVAKEKPDIVVFHGAEIILVSNDSTNYIPKLYNELNTLKSLGCIILRFSSYINNELSNIFSTLADVVIQVIPTNMDKGEQKYKLYLWKKGGNPYIMTYEEVQECLKEFVEVMRRQC